jgi:insertion element IS1 protein InsB
LKSLDPAQRDVIIRQVKDAEGDERWSFVGSKSQQRWFWHAIDHQTGDVLASVCGTREDETFLKLQELLAPLGITHFYPDGWGAYRRHLDPAQHSVGTQHTQKIERKHTTLRARIKRFVRKTMCFSRSIFMHDLVIGLFINRYEFRYVV